MRHDERGSADSDRETAEHIHRQRSPWKRLADALRDEKSDTVAGDAAERTAERNEQPRRQCGDGRAHVTEASACERESDFHHLEIFFACAAIRAAP